MKILTKSKQAKFDRDARICKDYLKLKKAGNGSWSIIDSISSSEGLASNTVYKITSKVRSKDGN